MSLRVLKSDVSKNILITQKYVFLFDIEEKITKKIPP